MGNISAAASSAVQAVGSLTLPAPAPAITETQMDMDAGMPMCIRVTYLAAGLHEANLDVKALQTGMD